MNFSCKYHTTGQTVWKSPKYELNILEGLNYERLNVGTLILSQITFLTI